MERDCFRFSKIRKLVVPSSIESIGEGTFLMCSKLEFADLSAARDLKVIGPKAFASCKALRTVLLNDGLEKIGTCCFEESGLEEVTIPGSLRKVSWHAFS